MSTVWKTLAINSLNLRIMKKTGRKSESDPLQQKPGKLVKKRVSGQVSKNHKAEAELKESEERYRLLFENSGESILLTNPDGSIYSANPAACRMYGRALSCREVCFELGDCRQPLRLGLPLVFGLASRECRL